MSETSPAGLGFPQSWVLVIPGIASATANTAVHVYAPGTLGYCLPESFRRKVAQRLLIKMNEQEVHWREQERKYGKQYRDVRY